MGNEGELAWKMQSRCYSSSSTSMHFRRVQKTKTTYQFQYCLTDMLKMLQTKSKPFKLLKVQIKEFSFIQSSILRITMSKSSKSMSQILKSVITRVSISKVSISKFSILKFSISKFLISKLLNPTFSILKHSVSKSQILNNYVSNSLI